MRIPLSSIKKYNLLEDYTSFFKNKKYEQLLIQLNKIEDIKILKKIGLNYSKLRKLIIINEKKENEQEKAEDEDEDEDELDNNLIFKKKTYNLEDFYYKIFKIFETNKNLEYLYFGYLYYKFRIQIPQLYKPYFLNPLNNLKNLICLHIVEILLSEPFEIMLPNLEKVSLYNCNNIILYPKISTQKIKYLKLEDCEMEIDYKYNFDNLEELIYYNSRNFNYHTFIDIDYSSLKKLKLLKTQNVELILNILKYTSIEKLEFYKIFDSFSRNNYSLEDEIKIYESILHNKTLKEITVFFYIISNEDLKGYENEICNNTLNKIVFTNIINNFDYTYFLKKFTCLKEIEIINNVRKSSQKSEGDENIEYIKLKNDENIIIYKIRVFTDLDLILSF